MPNFSPRETLFFSLSTAHTALDTMAQPECVCLFACACIYRACGAYKERGRGKKYIRPVLLERGAEALVNVNEASLYVGFRDFLTCA